MKRISIYVTFIGLIGLMVSCQNQESKTEMLATIIAPTIKVMPPLSFTKGSAADTITIVGTKVNPGYQVSATYYLEADTAGDLFAHPVFIASSSSDLAINMTVSQFNSTLLSNWNPYVTNHLEFRIRAVFDQSNAGTGVPPIVSISPTFSDTVILYGLPQLNLVGSGIANQNIQSINSDGNFSGLVKLNTGDAFTLQTLDGKISYGVNGTTFAVGGAGIVVPESGWYNLLVDTNSSALSIAENPYMVGMIGTFDGWASPDHKMDYAKKGNFWYTTVSLLATDQFKFRLNDAWPADFNWGEASGQTGYSGLISAGSSGNIPSPGTGTYYVTFAVSGSNAACTLTPVSSK